MTAPNQKVASLNDLIQRIPDNWSSMITDPRFIAFNREAELAKRLTCSGLTALRKATPSAPGIYYDAFSVGQKAAYQVNRKPEERRGFLADEFAIYGRGTHRFPIDNA